MRLANRLDELPRVREWLRQLPVLRDFATDKVDEVWLILDELLTNIISYGYDGARDREIEVTVGSRGERLLLEIRDDAKAFNPLQHVSTADAGQIGGWGLMLVRKLADALDYTRSNEYNVLRIEKAIAPRPAPPESCTAKGEVS